MPGPVSISSPSSREGAGAFSVIDACMIMPNHLHGIVVIGEAMHVGAAHASPLRPGPEHHSLGAIVGSIKSAASRYINRLGATPGPAVW
jgi:putative transposase